jgi:hypothetical protein
LRIEKAGAGGRGAGFGVRGWRPAEHDGKAARIEASGRVFPAERGL